MAGAVHKPSTDQQICRNLSTYVSHTLLKSYFGHFIASLCISAYWNPQCWMKFTKHVFRRLFAKLEVKHKMFDQTNQKQRNALSIFLQLACIQCLDYQGNISFFSLSLHSDFVSELVSWIWKFCWRTVWKSTIPLQLSSLRQSDKSQTKIQDLEWRWWVKISRKVQDKII